MPRRIIDFESLWDSTKLSRCKEEFRVEYAWLYGLCGANGVFEMTHMRSIWGKVAAIRPRLTVKKLERIFSDFNANGLLYVWKEGEKRYGYWIGSDKLGRLPKLSQRSRYEKLNIDVPNKGLSDYLAGLTSRLASDNKRDGGGVSSGSAVLGGALTAAPGVDDGELDPVLQIPIGKSSL